jgi:hypothetical protein
LKGTVAVQFETKTEKSNNCQGEMGRATFAMASRKQLQMSRQDERE